MPVLVPDLGLTWSAFASDFDVDSESVVGLAYAVIAVAMLQQLQLPLLVEPELGPVFAL